MKIDNVKKIIKKFEDTGKELKDGTYGKEIFITIHINKLRDFVLDTIAKDEEDK